MNKQLSFPACLSSIRDYLSPQAMVWETDEQGRPGMIRAISELNEHTFYIFHSEAALAVGHAIEDLALDEANGRLLSGLPDPAELDAERERFLQLGATIDQVEVVGSGRTPRLRRVRVIKDRQHLCRPYRLTAYEGSHCQALFIGRQTEPRPAAEEMQFFGFFTLNAGLIARLRQEFLDLAAGRMTAWREFVRQAAIDQAAKQMQREFARQEQSLELAMRRLQVDGERYCAGNFASDLEKGLSRLHQWKTRMPEILARAERPQGL